MPINLKLVSCAACLLGSCGYCYFSGSRWFFSYLLMPAIKLVDPEKAQKFGVNLAARRLIPKEHYKDDDVLSIYVWGKLFSNPIGLAAGFDKHAEVFHGMLDMGFGFVEVGSVTPFPQIGNPKPRIFRLEQDKAVINRCGFNSQGHKLAKTRLREWRNKQTMAQQFNHKHIGVNLGKNKNSIDSIDDYVQGIQCLGPFADYIVINVSSPNTPGLRDMQRRQQLAQLVDKVLEKREMLSKKPPLLIKIAPDLTREGMEDIASVVTCGKGAGVDGIVVSNTTLQRPSFLRSKWKVEAGGLSGKPLNHISTKIISDMYILTEGKVPIIGVGGVFTGKDAYEMITAGASLVQIYTSLSYEGPPIVRKIKSELADILRKEGYKCVADAVGTVHDKNLPSLHFGHLDK